MTGRAVIANIPLWLELTRSVGILERSSESSVHTAFHDCHTSKDGSRVKYEIAARIPSPIFLIAMFAGKQAIRPLLWRCDLSCGFGSHKGTKGLDSDDLQTKTSPRAEIAAVQDPENYDTR